MLDTASKERPYQFNSKHSNVANMYRLRKVSNKSFDLLQREAVTAHKKERKEGIRG